MTRPRASGTVQSVQDRLKNAARERGRPFAELLELYAVERFLHRLGRSAHRERFVLEGALLLRHWLGADTRPTRDVDLLGPADLDEETLCRLLVEVLEVDVEDDGIDFELGSLDVRPIRIGSAVLGLRAKLDAHPGRTRLRYQIDVGLGDAIYPPHVELVPGGLLGLPMASVLAYTPYTTVAEKLEAMVVLGRANSRYKDYYDLRELSRALDFDGPTLLESLRRTFARRATTLPDGPMEGLSEEFARDSLNGTRWQAFLAKGRLRVDEASLLGVVVSIRRFAEPVLGAAREDQPFYQHWPRGGPWQPHGDQGHV
ncbi:MAG TPA: nucleotidyl transferase AbiEii/AbiGii toxin family protein [Longimicrobiales bacterium]|nr:nucleotidyl transferase AbiEii/AbiGii toxin family protein [Longimicrobiales bacterium]